MFQFRINFCVEYLLRYHGIQVFTFGIEEAQKCIFIS